MNLAHAKILGWEHLQRSLKTVVPIRTPSPPLKAIVLASLAFPSRLMGSMFTPTIFLSAFRIQMP